MNQPMSQPLGRVRSWGHGLNLGGIVGSSLPLLKWVVVLGIGSGLVGCQPSPDPDRLNVSLLSLTGQIRSVEQIAQPNQVGKTVYVQGTVSDRIPLVSGSVYELTDATGTVWVVSNSDATTDPLDMEGQILLRGKVAYEATPEFGEGAGEFYLWEINRREHHGHTEH